jgi:hypothetical protein
VTREVIAVSFRVRLYCCSALHLAAVVLSCLCTPLVKEIQEILYLDSIAACSAEHLTLSPRSLTAAAAE